MYLMSDYFGEYKVLFSTLRHIFQQIRDERAHPTVFYAIISSIRILDLNFTGFGSFTAISFI